MTRIFFKPGSGNSGDNSAKDDSSKVFLRQSSWASREQIVDGEEDPNNGARRTSTSSLGANTNSNGGIFAKSRSIWERRTSQQCVAGDGAGDVAGQDDNAVRGGFRSNRDFWEQRVTMRQKQTPDLVLDLPVNTLSTSPGVFKSFKLVHNFQLGH